MVTGPMPIQSNITAARTKRVRNVRDLPLVVFLVETISQKKAKEPIRARMPPRDRERNRDVIITTMTKRRSNFSHISFLGLRAKRAPAANGMTIPR